MKQPKQKLTIKLPVKILRTLMKLAWKIIQFSRKTYHKIKPFHQKMNSLCDKSKLFHLFHFMLWTEIYICFVSYFFSVMSNNLAQIIGIFLVWNIIIWGFIIFIGILNMIGTFLANVNKDIHIHHQKYLNAHPNKKTQKQQIIKQLSQHFSNYENDFIKEWKHEDQKENKNEKSN